MKDRSEYLKQYREKNAESLKQKRKIYIEKNKDMITEGKRRYYRENKEYVLNKNRENYSKNIEKYRKTKNDYVKNRMKNDPLFKLKFNIRSLIRNSMKRKFTDKSQKTIDILGCQFDVLKEHIENQFDENMNWDNYGTYWEIDHIVPMASSMTEEEIYKLNHYTNFQPLYWLDNLHKSDRVT